MSVSFCDSWRKGAAAEESAAAMAAGVEEAESVVLICSQKI